MLDKNPARAATARRDLAEMLRQALKEALDILDHLKRRFPGDHPTPEERLAIDAALDGDATELVERLRSDRPMTIAFRNLLAALHAGELKKGPGRPRSTMSSVTQQVADHATEYVTEWRRQGYKNRVPGPNGRLVPINGEAARKAIEEYRGKGLTVSGQQVLELLRSGRLHKDAAKLVARLEALKEDLKNLRS